MCGAFLQRVKPEQEQECWQSRCVSKALKVSKFFGKLWFLEMCKKCQKMAENLLGLQDSVWRSIEQSQVLLFERVC